MIDNPVTWFAAVVALSAAVAVLAYRLGRATERSAVLELTGRCRGLEEQLAARRELESTLLPLRQAMSDLSDKVDTAERERVRTLSGLQQQVLSVGREVGQATRDVHQQALRITEALSRTQNQGAWGEMQLRRLVEASGMLAHVHFVEQAEVSDEGRRLRPDVVVDLGAGRRVVVDAKVSLDAFLDPDLDPDAVAEQHSRAVADHVTRLASKQYWKAVGTPEFVILFLPAEHMLGIALRARPDLLHTAFERKVVLATPTTLMATLRTVSWAWQQAAMADQARDVLEAGRAIHQRLSTMGAHVARMGKALEDAVGGYNQFIGSLDNRVMPLARRIADIVAPEDQVVDLSPVDVRARSAASLEGTAGAN
jgi:DNA recombination protein RmuC